MGEECAEIIKMPQELIETIIKARYANRKLGKEEAQKLNSEFREELAKWSKEYQREAEQIEVWPNLLIELAEGMDITEILMNLPEDTTSTFLDFFRDLRKCGFSDEYLKVLLTEMKQELLSGKLKQSFWERIIRDVLIDICTN